MEKGVVSEGPRYAIYFVPMPDTDLHRFGSAVLGYDCHTGADVPFPADIEIDRAEWATLTHEPRRYGFHATLKAPFYLSPASDEAQLANALENFAAFARLVPTIIPTVRTIGNFVALVPQEPSPALDALAADCVTIFDAFRAPITPQERARRVAAGLNHRQIANLDRWGYPHLFDDFRFHMTLTGPVPPHRREPTVALLSAHFGRAWGSRPIAIDRLALSRQDHGDARFQVIHQAALNG
jgi:putative phosphonate metabolism protein